MTLSETITLHNSLRREDLTFLQLTALCLMNEGITVTKLGRGLSSTKAAASELGERLVQMGLAHRNTSQTDRRVHQFTLSEGGTSKLKAILDPS